MDNEQMRMDLNLLVVQIRIGLHLHSTNQDVIKLACCAAVQVKL